jgi:hypothetical protein
MTTEAAVREAIRQHNSEVGVQAAACAILGFLGTFFTVVMVGFFLMRGARTPAGWLKVTLVVCGVLFLIGLISGLARGGTRGATDRFDDFADSDWLRYSPFYITADITAWAFLAWCLHGPYAFIEALVMLRHRIAMIEGDVEKVAALLRLVESHGAVPTAAVDPPRILGVALRLGLVKPSRSVEAPRSVVITEKGLDAVLLRKPGTLL